MQTLILQTQYQIQQLEITLENSMRLFILLNTTVGGNNWEAPASSWCRLIKNISILSWKDHFPQARIGTSVGSEKRLIKKVFPFSKAELLQLYLSIFSKVPYFFLNVLVKILIHHQAWFLTKKYIFGQHAHLRLFQRCFCKKHHGKCYTKRKQVYFKSNETTTFKFLKNSQNLFLVF